DDEDQHRQSPRRSKLLQPVAHRWHVYPEPAHHLVRSRPGRVNEAVVVALGDKAITFLLDDAMEDKGAWCQMVGDNLADLVLVRPARDHQVALVDERLHTDAAGDDVARRSAELHWASQRPNGRDREEDQND